MNTIRERPGAGVLSWLYMRRIIQKMERRLAAHFDQYDLTPAQFNVLAQLHRTPGIVQQELTDRLFVTKGNTVWLLNRLEQQGLVERRPCPEDGRAHQVYLTEQGANLAIRIVPEHEALVEQYMSVLSPTDQRSLRNALRILNHALGGV